MFLDFARDEHQAGKGPVFPCSPSLTEILSSLFVVGRSFTIRVGGGRC